MRSTRSLVLPALLGTAVLLIATGCGSHQKTMKSKATVRSRALTVADVKRAFAAEGVSLQSPFHESAGMPVTLIPENAGSALFGDGVRRRLRIEARSASG